MRNTLLHFRIGGGLSRVGMTGASYRQKCHTDNFVTLTEMSYRQFCHTDRNVIRAWGVVVARPKKRKGSGGRPPGHELQKTMEARMGADGVATAVAAAPVDLIAPSKAARIAGVTPAAITWLKTHNPPEGLFHGSKVNIRHPAWHQYLINRNQKMAELAGQKIVEAQNALRRVAEGDATEEEIADLAKQLPPPKPKPSKSPKTKEEPAPQAAEQAVGIRQDDVIDLARAKALKAQEDARIAAIKRRRLEGDLVEADFVRQMMNEYLATLNRRLLALGEKTVDRVVQLVQGLGRDARQPVIELLSDQVGFEISATKAELRKALEGMGPAAADGAEDDGDE